MSAPDEGRGPLQTATAMLNALRHRDLDTVLDCFDPADDTYVYPEGPRWTNGGGANIQRGWRAYFRAPIELRSWEWTDGPHEYLSDSLALVAGVIRYEFIGGGEPRRLPMRMTWVLRRGADGKWKILHEHGSQPQPDPYGTGDWFPAATAGPLDPDRSGS
jgi:ketosteroid isomerase-like protein